MKLTLKAFTIIILLFVQPCCSAALGDSVCQLMDKKLVIHRDFKTAETFCCLSVQCSRGEEPVLCDRNDPLSTHCRSCPDGTYQPDAMDSFHMHHCIAKTRCYGNLSSRYIKSKIRDTVCVCDPRLGVCNPAGLINNPRSCIKKTCNPGFRLTLNCTCEVCTRPENKVKDEEKPCDKRNSLCRNRQPISASETDISMMCLEEDPESPVNVDLEKKDGVESHELTSPSGLGPIPSSLINDGGQNDVTNDHLDVVKPVNNWYIVVAIIAVLIVVFVAVAAILFYFYRRKPRDSIKKSASGVSSSTDDTTDQPKAESSSLLSPQSSRPSAAEPALTNRTDAAEDNVLYTGGMKPSERKKLNAHRPDLVQSLIIDEVLWSALLSNGTITTEMRNRIEKSSITNSDKTGALITYLLTRDSRAFATFVAALVDAGYEFLARKLDAVLTAKTLQMREDGLFTDYLQSLEQSNSDVSTSTSHT